MKNKIMAVVVLVCMVWGLTACGSSASMPMEITVDGNTIVLGKTTMKDMTDLGYEVYFVANPGSIKSDAKYVPFYYTLSKGAGNEIHVTVCVPWGGKTNVSAEKKLAPTEGIIKRVEVRTSSVEKVTAEYNGVSVQDITFETAQEWGAKQDKDASHMTYEMTTSQGFVSFESATWSSEEFYSLSIELKQSAFNRMQK